MVFEAAIYQDKTTLAGSSNPENGLCRFEFLEAVVRLAKAKYIATGVEKTYSDAVSRIIKDNVIKYNPCEAWHGFRDKLLWQMEVNDLMEPNLPGLK